MIWHIASVTEREIRKGRKPIFGVDDRPVVGRKFDIVGFDEQYRRGEWFTRDPFKASLCEEARKARQSVKIQSTSCWWGEELMRVELAEEIGHAV